MESKETVPAIRQRGASMIEMAVAVVVAGVLITVGGQAISRYGRKGGVEAEAGKLVDQLWELRSKATTGVRNPCLDFPDNGTVRTYADKSDTADGYQPADSILGTYGLTGGLRFLSLTGGLGATHYVCFESKGMTGSAGSALVAVLGAESGEKRTIRLLPSTGIARLE